MHYMMRTGVEHHNKRAILLWTAGLFTIALLFGIVLNNTVFNTATFDSQPTLTNVQKDDQDSAVNDTVSASTPVAGDTTAATETDSQASAAGGSGAESTSTSSGSHSSGASTLGVASGSGSSSTPLPVGGLGGGDTGSTGGSTGGSGGSGCLCNDLQAATAPVQGIATPLTQKVDDATGSLPL